MRFINFKKLLYSFRCAFRGIYITFREEQNFRIAVFLSFVVIFFMIYYKVALNSKVILILTLIAGLVLEVLNTILEKIVDILKPRVHPYAEVIKDMMSGAVLLAFLAWLVTVYLIFRPYV
ncbi:MAG: diacylglycerol kinase [Candidatus Doudnabacteria bacterium]